MNRLEKSAVEFFESMFQKFGIEKFVSMTVKDSVVSGIIETTIKINAL